MKNLFSILIFVFFFHCSFGQVRTIHVFVALCDNENQGIVPVPKAIGNGKDTRNNLYWGAGYGVKNYFDRKTTDWKFIRVIKSNNPIVLERLFI